MMSSKPTYKELEERIQELEQAESDYKQIEKKFNFLNQISSKGLSSIITTDMNFKIICVNQAFEKLYEYTQKEIIGCSPDILNADPLSAEIQQDIYNTVSSGKPWKGDVLNKKKHGDTFMYDLEITPLIDENGELFAYSGYQKDITKRKQAEEARRESEEKYRLLAESMNDVIVQLSPAGELLYVSPNIKNFGGYDPESEIGNDMSKYFDNEADIVQAVELLEKVLETHQNGSFEFLFKPKDKKPFPVEHTYFPIVTNNKVVAIQLVLRDITERKQAEEKQRAANQQLKASNQQLEANNQQLLATEQQLRAANQQLNASEHELKKEKYFSERIVETADAIIVGLDKDHIIRIFNSGAERITGYTKAEVIGEDWFKLFFQKELLDEMNKVWENAWGISSHSNINPILSKAGKDIIVSWQTTGMYESEDVSKHLLLSIGEDITKRKQAEEELQKREVGFKSTLNNLLTGVVVHAADTSILFSNPEAQSILGLSMEQMAGKTAIDPSWSFVHADLTPLDVDDYPVNKVIATQKPFRNDLGGITSPDRNYVTWVNISAFPVFGDNNELDKIVVNLVDITKSKESEAALNKASQEWTLAMDAFDDIIYLLDNDRCVVQANSAFYKSMGITPDQANGRPIDDILHPHGEDKLCPICLAQKEKRDFVTIMEADAPNNPAKRPIEVKVKIVRNENGTTSGILVNLHDLTNARADEQKLLDSEKKLATLLNATSDIAFLAESDGTFLAVNNALAKSLDVEKEELINNSMFEFLSKEDAEKRKRKFQKTIESKSPFQWNDDRAGKYFDNSVYPIFDDKGNVKQIAAFTRDITDKVQDKLKLLKRENYLTALNQTKKILFSSNSEYVLQDCVDILGSVAQASRTYIFINHQNDKNALLMSQKAEYCMDGIQSEIDNPDLQNLSYDEFFSRWQKTLSEGKSISGLIKDFPKAEKEFLELQDIQAILIIPIMIETEFMGFIGFDNCTSERFWEQVEQDYLLAAAQDLGQFFARKRSQELLKADNLRFQVAMDALDAVVYVADMQTQELLFLNKYGMDTFGGKIGDKCYSALQEGLTEPCEFCTNHLLLDNRGNPNEPHIWEFQNTITKKWYQCRDQAIHWPDGRIVRLEIAIDITDRKLYEQNKLDVEKQILQTQKLKSMSLMAGGIAHDFNNILMGILGYADLALSEISPTSPARTYIKGISTSSRRAADLVKQVLAYSGRGKFSLEKIDLNALIDNSTNVLSMSMAKNITFMFNYSSDPLFLDGDPSQISQVVLNLVDNAIEAIGEENGLITLSTSKMHCGRDYIEDTGFEAQVIREEELPEGMYLVMEISDTGIGMSKETISRIFEPFFSTKFTGRGLGLSAVIGVVNGHHGMVKVYSEEGRGKHI